MPLNFFSNNNPAGLLFPMTTLLIRSRPFANDRLTLTSLMYGGLLKGNYTAQDLFPKQKYTQWRKSVSSPAAWVSCLCLLYDMRIIPISEQIFWTNFLQKLLEWAEVEKDPQRSKEVLWIWAARSKSFGYHALGEMDERVPWGRKDVARSFKEAAQRTAGCPCFPELYIRLYFSRFLQGSQFFIALCQLSLSHSVWGGSSRWPRTGLGGMRGEEGL